MNVPLSFQVCMEVAVDFRAKSNIHFNHAYNSNGNVHEKIVLFNIESGMCCVGHMESHDGGCSYNFINHMTYGIRDSKGLQFFCSNILQWRFFDESVQQAYAQFVIEREIK